MKSLRLGGRSLISIFSVGKFFHAFKRALCVKKTLFVFQDAFTDELQPTLGAGSRFSLGKSLGSILLSKSA